MKTLLKHLPLTAYCLLLTCFSFSDTYYVSLVGGNTAPYTSWATAAHVIQDAIDAASSGDTLLVTNGVYITGSSIPVGTGYTVPNRVLFEKNIYMRSVNGPENTIIVGQGPVGSSAIRCIMAWSSSPVIDGFTISNGHTKTSGLPGDKIGGGVYGSTVSPILSNCIIRCNKAQSGGGVNKCTLFNCVVSDNSASNLGGGNYESWLYNCEISGNFSSNSGGGLYYCSKVYDCDIFDNYANAYGGGVGDCLEIYNCRIFDNFAFYNGGGALLHAGDKLSCCVVENNVAGDRGGGVYFNDGGQIDNCLIIYNTSSLLQGGGAGLFFFKNKNHGVVSHCTIVANEPDGVYCYLGGKIYNSIIYYNFSKNYSTTGTSAVIEYCATKSSVPGAGNITNAPDFVFYQYYPRYLNDYHLKYTSKCINSGSATYSLSITDIDGTDRQISGPDMGCYERVPAASHHTGGHYASPSGGNSWPYSSLSDAAHNIQDAIDAAGGSETIHVSEGVYSRGFKTISGIKNRIVVKKNIKVRGSGDRSKTIILGEPDFFTGGIGTNVFRCAYLTNGAELANVTVSNGFTRSFGDSQYEKSGGGILLDHGGAVSNCIIAGNAAAYWGGGVFCWHGDEVNNCTISGNKAGYGGGVYCYFAGDVNNCTVSGNTADSKGGGIYFSGEGEANSCLISGNKTYHEGGGVYFNGGGQVSESTISGNSAADVGAGVYCFYGGTLINSIVYNNAAPDGYNWYNSGPGAVFSYCCTIPTIGLPGGDQCISDDPMFQTVGSDYHLLGASPCIDVGTNMAWMTTATDLDGNDRIYDGTVDMGCYEFIPEPCAIGAVISYLLLVLGIWRKFNSKN